MREFADKRGAGDRAHAFIDAWHAMPPGGEAEFRLGRADDGTPSILITIAGTEHGFRAREARFLVEMLDDTIKRYPDACEEIGAPAMRQTIITAIEMAEAQP